MGKPVKGAALCVVLLFGATTAPAQVSVCQIARDNLQSLEAMNTTGHLDALIARQRANVSLICSGEQLYRAIPPSSSSSSRDDEEDDDEPTVCETYGKSSPQCCADKRDSLRLFSDRSIEMKESTRQMMLNWANEHLAKYCQAANSPTPSTSASRAPEGYEPPEFRTYDTGVEERECKANPSSPECCKQKQLSLRYWPQVKNDHRFAEQDRQHIARYCQSRVQLHQNQGGVNVPPIREVRPEASQVQMTNECLHTYKFTRISGVGGTGVRYYFQNKCSHPIYFSVCTVQEQRAHGKFFCENVRLLNPGQSDFSGGGNIPMITDNKVHQSKLACRASTACHERIFNWVRQQRSISY